MIVKVWPKGYVVMTLDLLDHSRGLLRNTDGPRGEWHRAAALLTRQVLEETLDRLWDDHYYYRYMKKTSRYTQLACLKQLARDGRIAVDTVTSEDAHSAWVGLSRACHHHEYELTPTVPEIELLINQVEQLVEYMRSRPSSVTEG